MPNLSMLIGIQCADRIRIHADPDPGHPPFGDINYDYVYIFSIFLKNEQWETKCLSLRKNTEKTIPT